MTKIQRRKMRCLTKKQVGLIGYVDQVFQGLFHFRVKISHWDIILLPYTKQMIKEIGRVRDQLFA